MAEGMVLTNAGRNLLAKALTGKQLNFTRACVGDGNLGSRDQLTLTALISQKKVLPIQSILATQQIGTCEIVLEMSNSGLTNGFFVREYGLFATDPDTNKEVLYAYRNKGTEAGYLPGDNGIDAVNYTLTILTVIDQATNVTATISSANSYVTISRLEGRLADIFDVYTTAKGFYTYAAGDDQKLRKADIQTTRDIIMGVTDIQSLNARLERMEDNMATMFLALEMQNIYPGYTHYIVEDFINPDQIDMYTCQVTSVVAGDDSLDCVPVDGMIPGGWYTLTDGINSEQVQVQSINLENNIQRVILAHPVKNTYFLGTSKLYRTSATIDNEKAYGAGTAKTIKWLPTTVWKGQGSSTTYTINANTSLGSVKGFNITGECALTSEGYVTLEAE